MKTVLVFALLLPTFNLAFADEFDSIKCNSNIAESIVGKKSKNGKVEEKEKKHQDLGLKDLGADGLAEDPFVTISWLICGNEYVFLIDQLVKKGVISDVIQIPGELSKFPRALPGTHCTQQSKKVGGYVYAILGNDQAAKKAWRIDQKKLRFIEIPVADFRCEKE